MRAFILRLSRFVVSGGLERCLLPQDGDNRKCNTFEEKISAKQVRNLVRSATPGLIADGAVSPLLLR